MNIVVCIKQVPDVDNIKWTKENNLDRSQMLSTINKYDEYAIDWAMNIKIKFIDTKITVITMGPDSAKEILNHALAKGCNRAILLSDKMFAASDTLATSKILATAIKKYVPDYNLIITGQMALDGDTAQVPVSMSQLLNIYDITHAIEIINADKDNIMVRQKLDNRINLIETQTPCLIAVKEECPKKYVPKINDYIRAQNKDIECYGFEDLGLEKQEVGILGSPTVVYKAFRPDVKKDPVLVNEHQSMFVIDSIKKAKYE